MTEAQLRAFVAVAEFGGFGEAARRLHMSQPGVSRAVRALEVELGGDLFLRGHGVAVLTTLGARALVRSRAILGEVDGMRQERDEARGIASGHVRLGSMPSVSASILPALLSRLERRHPALSVTVLDGHDDELVAWVRAGTVDVAVVAGEHAGLELQPLVTDELLAVVPAAHPLAAQEAVRAHDLVGEPFILTRAGCERLVLAALGAQGVVPDISHEVSEASSILAMVGEGLGVSVMPGLAALRPPATVALRPLEPRAERRLSLAIWPSRAPSPAVRAFLAAAVAAGAAPEAPRGASGRPL
jgi:DNA-binding transcriptional LysR family regulator